MTKQAQKPGLTLVIADWKDVGDLLDRLRDALKSRGVVLQQWDIGSDDWIVTVAARRVSARAVAEEMDPDGETPGLPEEIR